MKIRLKNGKKLEVDDGFGLRMVTQGRATVVADEATKESAAPAGKRAGGSRGDAGKATGEKNGV